MELTWDDDLIEHLMVIFEKTYIRINQGNLSAMHWNQVWRDFVIANGAQYTMKQCQDKITNIKKNLKQELEAKSLVEVVILNGITLT